MPQPSLSPEELLQRLALLCCLESRPAARGVVEALGGWQRAPWPKDWAPGWHGTLARLGRQTREALHRHQRGDSAGLRRAEAELRWLEEGRRSAVFSDRDDWPARLERGPRSPAALFLDGDADLLHAPMVAVVGSRKQTTTGAQAANYFAAQLAQMRLGVVSGGAEGIDSTAHAAALENGGATIAVLGTGLAQRFPQPSAELQDRIAKEGLLVSEYLHAEPGLPYHFPARNRIIAALAEVVLVVEAGSRSGALGTARIAAEMGVEVMAVPGAIFNKMSRGCHQLLREGAVIAADFDDLVTATGRLLLQAPRPSGDNGPRLQSEDVQDPKDRELLACIDGQTMPTDLIAETLGRPVVDVVLALGELELQGLVSCEAGGYRRI